MLLAVFATAQTKKTAQASGGTKKPVNTTAKAIRDSILQDSITALKKDEFTIPKEFAVYTKRSKLKNERMKLCINLVSPDTILNHCFNDSLCRDPEVSRVLFEKKQGDSTFVLVYVRAFSKPADKPACDAGKEVKLIFFRWNTTTNKAIVKTRNVESCMRAITNMTKESIDSWDGQSPLIFKYHKGGQNFMEVKFDPRQYLLGFQSTGGEN